MCNLYPDARRHVNEIVSNLKESFDMVFDKKKILRQAMEDAHLHNKLQQEVIEWMGWITTMTSAITSNDLAVNCDDGVYLLHKHNAVKERIESKDQSFQDFMLRLHNALSACPAKSNEVSSFISNLKHQRKVSKNMEKRVQALLDSVINCN